MEKEITIKIQIPKASKPTRSFSMRLSHLPAANNPQFTMPTRLCVLPVTPGDFNAFRLMLLKTKVIDKYYRWTYKRNHLLLLGAAREWGADMVEYLWFIFALYEKARAAGGAVHFLLGIHELSKLTDRWRFDHPAYGLGKSNKEGFTALYGGNLALWNWLKCRNVVELTGQILLAGPGIDLPSISGNASLQYINQWIKDIYTNDKAVENEVVSPSGHISDELPVGRLDVAGSIETEVGLLAFFEAMNADTWITHQNRPTSIKELKQVQILNIGPQVPGLLIRRNKVYALGQEGDWVRIEKQ